MAERDSLVRIDTGAFTIEGKSRAGNETWFRIRELGIALDIGRCPDGLIGVGHVFITHAHLDHALGIPFHAAQRKLQRLEPASVYVPAESVGDFHALMQIHEKLENTVYPMNLIGMAPGDTTELRRGLRARAHRSTHRVVANGYEFIEIRHKLRPEHAGMSDAEIFAIRNRGEPLTLDEEHSILFYTGDTDRRVFDESPALFRSDVLMIECSFTGSADHDRAERYSHLHFDDLCERSGKFENRLIVLTHFSLRDRPEEIQRQISRRCPAGLRERIRLALPGPFVRIDEAHVTAR